MSKVRSPQEQANDFIAANDRSPVIAGRAIGHGGKGGVYTLKDLSKHRLGGAAMKLLPDGYPRWDFPF